MIFFKSTTFGPDPIKSIHICVKPNFRKKKKPLFLKVVSPINQKTMKLNSTSTLLIFYFNIVFVQCAHNI